MTIEIEKLIYTLNKIFKTNIIIFAYFLINIIKELKYIAISKEDFELESHILRAVEFTEGGLFHGNKKMHDYGY